MAQSNFEERIDTYEIESTNVMTGDRDRSRYLYYQLKMSMAEAKQIDIIVSFLMESGVRMLLNDMKRALDRGVKIRILTGNYLGITQPSALYLIKSEIGDRVDLRLYNETSRSFHPKSYIFYYESSNEIYIGSSNISKSALTSGIEWNYRFSDTLDKKNYELFYATFEDLFLNHSIIIDDEELKRYSKAWKKPAVSKDLAKYDATEDGEDRNAENVRMLYRPRGAQIEALYALQESRMEGAAKGLVYAATGIGKTYLAAFDSAKYERVLFVAHREEILRQAAVSFKNVRNSENYGFFDGKEKDRDKSVIFASVATLGRPEYLNETYFPADYFDYVIIDEFHHAVTDQYRRIVEYFQPQFLLGLTATPERMDGKNIYEICDYNVPYQISLKEAINKGMLVPFHYYGVYDETDYSRLRIVKGRYDEQELNQAYIGNERRYDLIYKYYRKYRSSRAIGFCCSRQHAEDMAKEFCQRGVASAAVYSGENGAYAEERNEAIRKLKNGEIRVIFSVDAIAITIGFVCTVIFGKMWSAPDKNKNDKKNDTKENDTTKAVITEEPGAVYAAAEGTVKDIEASTDPTFANKVLGDGVVIFPEDGTVMAPCKATVSLVYPTGHAIGLTTADGAEILIHCGVDTVNMNGEGFETLVKEGQEVTAEEALIRFDIDLVKKHGYSPEILVIFTELPEGKTIKTEEKHIAKNDKMAEIV